VTRLGKLAAGLTAIVVSLTLTGCGNDDTEGGDTTVPKTIEVTFEGDSITPNGDRIEVTHGQDVILHVTADAPGEIHVHSSPEQEFEYDAGETDLTITDLDQPGVVEVESHTLDKVIVQLEVR